MWYVLVHAGVKPGCESRVEVLDLSILGFWVQTGLMEWFLLQTHFLGEGAGSPHLLPLGNVKLLEYFCSSFS